MPDDLVKYLPLITIFIIVGNAIIALIFFYLMFSIKHLLENILTTLGGNKQKNKYVSLIKDTPKDWSCPKCNTTNNGNSFTCKKCDYNLV